ncbi:Y-family DNA polymerase [Mucilaginibacter daejeonensis]|uniref:Y-family DNA polymerase n=1 Tax=Mucilaginibacter daejeonensis TaxID=398049 RepID=UPI001D17C677|nr:Y-family DNA polymerase [Mucilaginibacter daejeonensis]UEG51359.1 Y-family DNA polymerase [Mucilaginibacter daejeonensis]
MVAIADCVGFYAAYHQSTEPHLKGAPVVALSNNDGCIIALSPEAKALGAVRCSAWYMVQEEYEAKGFRAFSSNYREYQAMNKRLMKIMARYVPRLETYSIDECWMDLAGINDIEAIVPKLIKDVKQLTGIQIRIGVAPTKTLAKVAINLAKTTPDNFCILDNSDRIQSALRCIAIEDLWNVGAQYAALLHRNGIRTAARLSVTPEYWVRKKMTVLGWRTLQELNGIPCLDLVEVMNPKKNIGVGRSFKKTTSDEQTLVDAATYYSFRLSEKLREEKLVATVLQIKLRTNKWRVDTAQHQPCMVFHLDKGISNGLDITKHAQQAVRSIVAANRKSRAQYKYMKFEINASGLVPEDENQILIGDQFDAGAKNRLSRAIDMINLQLGKGKVCFANNLSAWKQDTKDKYIMRQEYKTPNYFTDWNEAPILH